MSKTLPPVPQPAGTRQSASPQAKPKAGGALPAIGSSTGSPVFLTQRPERRLSHGDAELRRTVELQRELQTQLAQWQPRGTFAEKKHDVVRKTIAALEDGVKEQEEVLADCEKRLLEVVLQAEVMLRPPSLAELPGKRSPSKNLQSRSSSLKKDLAAETAPRDPALMEVCRAIYMQKRGASVVEVVSVNRSFNGRRARKAKAPPKKVALPPAAPAALSTVESRPSSPVSSS
eukprot:RCo040729